jgi:glycosyltransferase involved in cell wall biosynthesis
VYPTQAFADAMVRAGLPAPSAVIASGVSEDLPVPAGGPPPGARPEVLAVHNWYLHKRVDWLVETWAGDDRFAQWTLRVVGAAPNRSVARRVRAAAAGAGDRVVLDAPMPRAELAALFGRASYYLSASVLEAFPLTPLEAMGAGVPCVLSDIPTHREVAGTAAVYFRPDDADSLLRALATAEEHRAALTARGRQRATQYPWDANARAFRAQFEALLSQAAARDV